MTEDRYVEPRINADKLHSHPQDETADSEDEQMMVRLASNSTNLPMGIYRREHKDAEVVVATTAEVQAAENATGEEEEEESLWIDGGNPGSEVPQIIPEEGHWTRDGKSDVTIKTEPNEDDGMDLDDKSELLDESKGKGKGLAIPIAQRKKTLPLDTEEKIIQADLDLLANELGSVAMPGKEGDTKGETTDSNRDGRLYLFQFPPLLPPLRANAAPPSPDLVKAEAKGVKPPQVALTVSQDPVDLTQEYPIREQPQDQEENNHLAFTSDLLSQGGLIGNLNVHKSGKVSLDWGGRTLDMSPATAMNFLTTAVIIEENENKEPQPGVTAGESIGMGQIMGRFVLAPTWEEEDDWVVDPKDLEVAEELSGN